MSSASLAQVQVSLHFLVSWGSRGSFPPPPCLGLLILPLVTWEHLLALQGHGGHGYRIGELEGRPQK